MVRSRQGRVKKANASVVRSAVELWLCAALPCDGGVLCAIALVT